MRRTYRKSPRQKTNRRKTNRHTSKSGSKPSVNNSISGCVSLFRKYRLTNQTKLVKWINHNHPDKVKSKQSPKLQDDYKFIMGCFGQRKQILKQLKSKSKSKSKSKKKSSKPKKVKGDSWEW